MIRMTRVGVCVLLVSAFATAAFAQKKPTAPSGDARLDWVSPNWDYAFQDTAAVNVTTSIFLWVLNPGDTAADVTLSLKSQGVDNTGHQTIINTITCATTVAPGVAEPLWIPLICDPGVNNAAGSLEIVATVPVVPSAYTQVTTTYKDSGQPDVRHAQTKIIPMQFYAK